MELGEKTAGPLQPHYFAGLKRLGARRREVNGRIPVEPQDVRVPSEMVPMIMGDEDIAQGAGVQSEGLQILEQDGSPTARVEEQPLAIRLYEAGEAPGGFEARLTGLVVINNGNLHAHLAISL
jgi:hypothetical protein